MSVLDTVINWFSSVGQGKMENIVQNEKIKEMIKNKENNPNDELRSKKKRKKKKKKDKSFKAKNCCVIVCGYT